VTVPLDPTALSLSYTVALHPFCKMHIERFPTGQFVVPRK
jgi:hypothetical protein